MIARWTIVGFVIWLGITAAFRFVGESVFQSGFGGVSWLFLTMPIALFAFTYTMLAVLKVDPSDRAEAAAIFALPGLIIGTYVINSFPIVFPNIDPSLGKEYAALMFASYGAVSLSGILSSRLQQVEKTGG